MIRNTQIADAFDEIADLLELQQANPFRVRAYRNAARVLRGMKREAADMLKSGEALDELPGIGADLAGKIRDVVQTGSTELLFRLHRALPAGLVALLKVPGLGPKRVKLLHDRLKISSLQELKAAIEAGRLEGLKGVGPKIIATVTQSLKTAPKGKARVLRARVAPVVAELIRHLRRAPGVGRVAVAGSFRRGSETVGDIDILATARDGAAVIAHFTGYEDTTKVLAKGDTRATIVVTGGLQVDLRVVAEESYGAALVYFTGSKAHNIAIRGMALKRKLKINEYGVFRGKRRIAGETEDSVYAALGLSLPPPELREDRGEIDAAKADRLPQLVERKDLRGDLHCHTEASDGEDSLADMAAAARAAGLEYLAITDHSQRLAMVHGLDRKRLARQGDAIDRLNATLRGFRILKGIEVDILEDGSLDLPDEALAGLDLVVASIHSHFNLSPERQTARLLRALERPYVSILAHPTGRLLGQREGCRYDLERIIATVKQRGAFLELNAQPERLDLDDVHCRTARDAGVLISIASDSHRVGDFDFLAHGVTQARRGWLRKADVLNTRGLRDLAALLKRTRLR